MLPTFPSRYWSTIGLQGVFSLAGWSPRFLTGFLVSRHTQVSHSQQPRYPYGGVTRSARPSQTVPVPRCRFRVGSYYPGRASTPPVWAPSVSIATTPDIDISFSSCRYLDVSVPCVRSGCKPVTGRLPAGFPHSDTPGSIPVLGSPGFFAVVRVLRRLLKPRHPPCALIAFCSVLAGPKTGRALKLLNFRPLLLLPRYLFPSIVNELLLCEHPFFRNGLQRYRLFLYFQIFLQNFSEISR